MSDLNTSKVTLYYSIGAILSTIAIGLPIVLLSIVVVVLVVLLLLVLLVVVVLLLLVHSHSVFSAVTVFRLVPSPRTRVGVRVDRVSLRLKTNFVIDTCGDSPDDHDSNTLLISQLLICRVVEL